MDPLGAEATFAGTMHNILGGVVAFATILMPLFMGLGLRKVDGFRGYTVYSFISSAIIFTAGLTGVILSENGFLVCGLFEQITIGTYEMWIFITALRHLKTGVFEQLWETKPSPYGKSGQDTLPA